MKHLIRKTAFLFLQSIIFMVNVSCPQDGGFNMWVGVGRNVDETPPVITVTSPIDGSYLGERDLTISGTASDNVGVTKISIEMQDMSTGDTLVSGTNCNSMTSGVWEVVFTYSDLNKLKLFNNADNKQVYFRITAYDAMMNEAFSSLLLRVDNSAPTATWVRPVTSSRFKDSEHNLYMIHKSQFDMKYSMDKTDTIGYFHNGVEQFSGFVDDNSKAAQTYLRFYKSDAAGNNILAAVTPVIKGTVTDDNSNDINIVGRAPELSDTASAVQEIGTPVVSASPASWKYDIDTNELSALDGDDGWYRVVIATRDGADNTCDQLDSPEWILINQDADMPRNKFNIRKGVSINVNGQVSGIAFDDDGVSAVYIAAIPDNSDDIKALTDKSPTEWMPDDCTSDVYTTETAVYARILAADTDNGAPTLNWSITVPITGIGYRLFVVPVDINGLWQHSYADETYDALYHTTFRVASIEDPVISLTTRVVDMTSDTAVITGYFYDNKEVTKIEAVMSSYMTLGGEVKSDVSADIYNGTGTAVFIITDTTIDTLSTGQKVTKHFFNWIFAPNVFVPDLGYSSMEILLYVYDDEGRYGNDTLNVYGDSERPMFDRVSPPNNSTITEDMTFDGWIYDNIGITELRLYCKGLTSQFTERRWVLGGVNDLNVDSEPTIYDGTNDALKGKYGRHFSTVITPSQIGYGTPLVIIEAADRAGNTNEYQINIKGDNKSPEVAFPGMSSGKLMNETSKFPIRVLPVINDRAKKLYRGISSVTLTLKDENNTSGRTIDGWEWNAEDGAHIKTYNMSSFTHDSDNSPFSYDMTVDVADLNLVDYGLTDINITVTAIDLSENEGKATLYFIIDKQGPNIQLTPIGSTSVYGTTVNNQVRGTANDRSNIASILIAITGSTAEPSASDTTIDIIDYIFKEEEDVNNIAEFALITKNEPTNSVVDNVKSEYYIPKCNFIYNGGANFTDSNGALIINTAVGADIQSLYIWAKGIDILGNESAWTNLGLRVNPHADRPKIELDYPENVSTVGGSVRVSGSTEIADTTTGVASVWIQIDPDYVGADDGSNFDEDWETKLSAVTASHSVVSCPYLPTTNKNGILVTGTKSWSYMINSLREFNKVDGSGNKINRKMAVRAFAVSGSNKVSEPVVTIFTLDPNAPVFGDAKSVRIEDKDDDSIYKIYSEKMWIVDGQSKQQWRLAGDISDEDGISDLSLVYTIKRNGESVGEKNYGFIIKDGTIINSEWVTEFETLSNGHHNYTFSIPIIMDDMTADADTTGTVEITMEAFEDTNDKKSATQNCIINYDMESPVLTITGDWDDKANNYVAKITQLTEDAGDFITLKGSVTESGTQSGFARVAMQVTRVIDGKTYVIDPMLSKGAGDTNANRHQVDGEGKEANWEKIAGLWCYKMTGVDVNESMLTLPVSPRSKNIRLKSMCFINGMPYLITDVNETSKILTISGQQKNNNNVSVYFPVAQIIDNQKSEDTNTLPTVFDYDGVDNWGDGDQMKESVRDNGNEFTWTARINSWNIYDGLADFVFTAFDNADNWTSLTKHAKIANNEPRLAGVSFGCDDNADGVVSDSEKNITYSGWYNKDSSNKADGVTENGKNAKLEIITSFNCPAKIDVDGYVFVIKDGIRITPEVVGGNGNLSWKLYYQPSINNDTMTLIEAGDSGISASQTDVTTFDVSIDAADLSSIITADVENQYLRLEISDSTLGSPNVSTIVIKMATLLHDAEAPNIEIGKFYWKDKTRNSVCIDGVIKGHIELEKDLTFAGSTFTSGSGLMDKDPKVSGTVIFDGTADDNVIVETLSVKIPGFNSDASIDWTRTDGVFVDLSSDTYKFHCVSDYFDPNTGTNTVVWQFIWNSEKLSPVAKTDVVVTAKASDIVGNHDEGDTDTYKIDVVPYVTGVATELSKLKVKNPSVYNRTALGHYPVNGGKPSNANNTSTLTAETVTFTGYNLGADVTLDVSSLVSGKYDFTTVNGVKALNNYNNNNAKGDYAGTTTSPTGDYDVYSNYYNRQPNNDNNNLLTDDVYFDVWGINPMAVQPKNGYAVKPVMAVNPTNHDVGFAFVNGTLYFSMPNGNTRSYEHWIGGYDFWTSVGLAYDSYGNSYATAAGGDIADNRADTFRIMTSRWGTCFLGVLGYDEGWNQYRLEYIAQADYHGSNTVDRNFNKERIQSPSIAATASSADETKVYLAYYDDINDEIRFKHGVFTNNKIKNWYKYTLTVDDVAGAGVSEFFGDFYGRPNWNHSGDNGDRNPTWNNVSTDDSVEASEWLGKKTLEERGGWYSLAHNSLIAGQTKNKEYISYTWNGSSLKKGTKTSISTAVVTANGATVCAGKYVSIAAIKDGGTSDDAVIAVWWDAANSQLLYSYNLTPNSIAVGQYAQEDTKWTTPVAIFGAANGIGEYCKVTVDKMNGVHIAAYDSLDGDLCYAYIPDFKTPSGAKTCIVDSYGIIGTELNIDVALDANNKPIPYISYYAGNSARPKIAHWSGAADITSESFKGGAIEDITTGEWEISIIPTTSKVSVDHINVGVWKNADGKLNWSTKDGSAPTAGNVTNNSFKSGTGSTTSYGTVWGNGSKNPILGYAVTSGSSGYIETAQMK